MSKPITYPSNVTYSDGFKDAIMKVTERLEKEHKRTGLGFIQYESIAYILKNIDSE
jgi:hypothetical protein